MREVWIASRELWGLEYTLSFEFIELRWMVPVGCDACGMERTRDDN